MRMWQVVIFTLFSFASLSLSFPMTEWTEKIDEIETQKKVKIRILVKLSFKIKRKAEKL